MSFGEKMKAERIRQGMSQMELANRSGIGQTTVSAIEKGGRSPSEETMMMLAHGLCRNLGDLLDDVVTPADTLTPEEWELIQIFRDLDREGRDIVMACARGMTSAAAIKKETARGQAVS